MIQMRYVGSRYPSLRGKTALVQAGDREGTVKIQLDDCQRARTGKGPVRVLGYGWHEFPADEWEPIRRKIVVRDEHGEVVQEWPEERGCGGGPNTCGGCSECMAQQAVAAGFDVTTEDEVPT